MAVTWEVTIIPHSIEQQMVRLAATRTDTVAGIIDSFLVRKVYVEQPVGSDANIAALDKIWDQWLDLKAKRTAAAAFIGTLETAAKSNLEARE